MLGEGWFNVPRISCLLQMDIELASGKHVQRHERPHVEGHERPHRE